MRIVRRADDDLVADLIAECQKLLDGHLRRGEPAPEGLESYLAGLQTAAICLGAVQGVVRRPWWLGGGWTVR